GREFRRCAQIKILPIATRTNQIGGKGMQMGFVARGNLQGGRFDLKEALPGKPGAQSGRDPRSRQEEGPAGSVDAGQPERRAFRHIYLVTEPARKGWHPPSGWVWCGPNPRPGPPSRPFSIQGLLS